MIASLRFLLAATRDLTTLALVALVRCYQLFISPWLGDRCRFRPTCSEYAVLAVRRYGPFLGLWKTAGRLLRCHPWSRGGWDPP